MAKNRNWEKKKTIIRDVFDGRIIKDKEAISLRNAHLVMEKEAIINGENNDE